MMRGLSTLRFQAADLDKAKAWYTQVLGIAPYFEQPGYMEFRLGDYQSEFGIMDSKFAVNKSAVPAGAVVYWHVDNLPDSYQRLLSLGANPFEPPRDFGHGFVGASVVDPFGNILGIMYNPHYLEILEATRI